ncbi:MAG: alpha/beta hydrolase-fold protein, partial [Bacteroidota bacterium]
AAPMNEGDAQAVLDNAEGVIEATYDVPYLAHACMEPINCTVYNLYTPASDQKVDTTLMLYLLHGHGGDREDWFQKEEGNAASLLDSLIGHGVIPPMRAVSLSAGNSWYVDRELPMETFYISEFIPAIERQLGIDMEPARIIAGNSAGGYGALRFSMKYPDLFDEVILLSPASYEPLPPDLSSSRKVAAFAKEGVFNDSVWNSYSYTHLIDPFITSNEQPNYHLSVGDDDAYNIVPVVASLQQLFLEYEVENELRITNGGHDWKCWQTNFTNALQTIFKNN